MKSHARHYQPARRLLGGLAFTDGAICLAQVTNAWPYKVIAFLGLSLLPGAALVRSLRAEFASGLERLVYVFGLSILCLILSALAINQLLFSFGVDRPLQLAGIWAGWNGLCLALIAAVHLGNRYAPILSFNVPSIRPLAVLGTLLPAALPCLAAMGAFRLNNGGDAVVAMGGLWFAAVLMVVIFALHKRLPDGVIAWFIFCLGLAVLLMVSLRSWDITGHDIAREFQVYTLAHQAEHWNIGVDHDAYNACLSITILPEAYAKLLHISGLIAFKFILQIIFAACPVVVYVLLRRHLGKLGALAACMLFISYPTFINDSAMLTRQGVAYVFFALAMLIATKKTIEPEVLPQATWTGGWQQWAKQSRWNQNKARRLLFLLCGLGVIFSHYSTTYMFVGLFGAAVMCKAVFGRLLSKKLQYDNMPHRSVLKPSLVIVLTLGAFMWFAQATATSGGLTATLAKSITGLPHMLSDDNRSSDTSASLMFSSSKSQLDVYDSFMRDPKVDGHVAPPESQPVLTDDDVPLTQLGKTFRAHGLDPSRLSALRQYVAKLLQLMALLGAGSALYRFYRRRPDALSLDYLCLCLAGLTLLGCILVLPTISLNYGILRAFQQSLIFLLVPMALLPALIAQRFQLRPWRLVVTIAAGMAALFLVFTGFVAQILGGSDAALTLNNRGLYYGLYYTTAADLDAYNWMQANIARDADVRAASYGRAAMHHPSYPFRAVGILPTQLHTTSYVYLDQAQLLAGKYYTYYQGTSLITTFPMSYFESSKNLIYTTGTTGVYR